MNSVGSGLDDAEVGRLARLPFLEYDRQRTEAAETLGVRMSVLDRMVCAERDKLGLDDDDDSKQGRAISFPATEPWPEAVDGVELLEELADAIRGRKPVTKTNLKLITPTTDLRTVVAPRRKPNAELRSREYLTETEVEALTDAAKDNRWGHRDATMILVAYRHGLRVSELVDLRWDQIDFDRATLAVRRVKQGSPATHPVQGDELRALRRLQREQDPKSPFVFTSERGSPFTTSGFARMVERAGVQAKLGFKTHPHMLRHACGYALANKGHDTRSLQAYLGHKNIQHTVRYTELSPDRFKDFWR